MYAFEGEPNGGPPALAGLSVGNSRQIKLASGESFNKSDILCAQAGRILGFMAQKN